MADNIVRAPDGFQIGATRVFVQPNGSYPDSPFKFQGCLQLGESEQDLGDSTPVYCPDPSQPNKWIITDTINGAPGLPTVDGTQRMARNLRDIWMGIAEKGCFFNLQEKIFCEGRGDDYNAWDGKWLMFGARMTARTIPLTNPLSGEDNAIADLQFSITYRQLVRCLRLICGTRAESLIVSEILDGFYYDAISCGACGTAPSDGCQKSYWLAAASGGSPGLSSRIVYTTDGWSTSNQLNITPLGGTDARRIAPMGQYLIGVAVTAAGHFYELFSEIDAGTTNFTLITSGYTTAPRAIYVKSPSEAFIAGTGGYIYYLADPTASPTVINDNSLSSQNLNDISGSGDTVVAVGDSNTVIYSTNGGESFASVTGPAVGVALNTVQVLPTGVWWVGSAAGVYYWTRNNGVTWYTKNLTAGNTQVDRQAWVDENVGYVTTRTSSVGRVYSTHDAGATWQLASNSDRRLSNVPSSVRFLAVATCGYNVVGIGGAKTNGGDGVLAQAE